MCLSYLVVFGIIVFNVLNFLTLMKKERFGKTFATQFQCYFYIATHCSPLSKTIDISKKNKGGQKLYDVNVTAFYGCRQVGAVLKKLCCYLNIPEPMLSINYQNI